MAPSRNVYPEAFVNFENELNWPIKSYKLGPTERFARALSSALRAGAINSFNLSNYLDLSRLDFLNSIDRFPWRTFVFYTI
jgi:hypothetical protein